MMQKPATAAVQNDTAVRQQELEKLVAEMNGNVGPKKIEAMAAILTRLVDQSKIQAATAAPWPSWRRKSAFSGKWRKPSRTRISN